MTDHISRALANSALIDSGIVGQDLEKAVNAITAVPAADVRPVVRGEWKTAWLDHESFGERPRVLYCSACNQVAMICTPFCPHCGADMRKEAGTDGTCSTGT